MSSPIRHRSDEDAPKEVARWAAMRPGWLEVQPTSHLEDGPSLEGLDAGERAAILLAQRHQQVLLLMDETSGRREAAKRGIPTTGTLGVLRAASLRGFIKLAPVLARLMATNFRVSEDLVNELVAEHHQRARRMDEG